jgi:DNA-binding Lrp family transcriptional regulator
LFTVIRSPGVGVIRGYVLIHTEVGTANDVAAALRGLSCVTTAESVAGPYDVIARLEAGTIDELGELVVSRVQAIRGVLRTTTCPVIHRSERGPHGS